MIRHHGQEALVAGYAAYIFWRPSLCSADASGHFWQRVEREVLLDFNDVVPIVTEVIEVAKYHAGVATEITQPHVGFVEQSRTVLTPSVVGLRVAIPQAADAILVQVVVPPVEGSLYYQMQLPQMPRPRYDEAPPHERFDLRQRNPQLHGIQVQVGHERDFKRSFFARQYVVAHPQADQPTVSYSATPDRAAIERHRYPPTRTGAVNFIGWIT